MENLVKELENIEAKYTPKSLKKCTMISKTLHENIEVLSKELDSLGLSPINVEKSLPEILEEVVKFARNLVHIHRTTLNTVKEKNMDTVVRDHKYDDLSRKTDDYKIQMDNLRGRCSALKTENSLLKLEMETLKKRNIEQKHQLERYKQNYAKKTQILEHNIRKLQLELGKIQEIYGKNIVSKKPTNEVALQLLSKYKMNEEIYKSTIKKLQDNNQELFEEVFNLKEELILSQVHKD